MDTKNGVVELTAEIVAAYVGNNPTPQADLPRLIADVYRSLAGAVDGAAKIEVTEDLRPAVPVKKSIAEDYLACLECGKKFKSLKRHLRTHHNATPAQYRERWELPGDYPMVAHAYAKARSSLAKKMGLGQRRPFR